MVGTLRKLSRKGQGAGGQLHLETERESDLEREWKPGEPMLGLLTGYLAFAAHWDRAALVG